MYDYVKLKPLDDHACFHYSRYEAGVPIDVFLGVVLDTPLLNGDDEKAKSVLVKAAQYLLSQDRMLSAIPLGFDKEPFWAGITSKLDVESLVSIDHCSKSFNNTSSRIEYIYNQYLSQHLTFDGKPLWKIVLNRGHNGEKDVLMVAISHVLADGHSARRMLMKIIDFIQSDKAKEDIPINTDGTFPIQHSIIPSLAVEDVFSMHVPFVEILRMKILSVLLSKYFPSWLYKFLFRKDKVFYSKDNEKLEKFIPSLGAGVRVIILPSLYAATKSPLVASAASVNSVLYRLLDVALFETSNHFKRLSTKNTDTPAQYNKDSIIFQSNTAVKIESPNNSYVENFPGNSGYIEVLSSDTIFWKSVANYHSSIHNSQRSDTRLTARLLLRHSGSLFQLLSKIYLQSYMLIQRIARTYISNIGPLYDTGYTKDPLTKNIVDISNPFVFTMTTPFLLPTASFAISRDKTSETTVSFCWRKDSVSNDWVDYFEKVLQRSANKIVAQADNPDLHMTIKELVS